MGGAGGVPAAQPLRRNQSTQQDRIEAFRSFCGEQVGRWLKGKLDLHDAVIAMQAHAAGLVEEVGMDAVQAIMANAFRPYRRPGDGGLPP